MSELIRCDQCGRENVPDLEPNWRMVEYISDPATMGTDTRDKHFCSWRCVRDYTAKKADAKPLRSGVS